MVLKAVSFVCFLWIGAISALTSNNEDGFTATLERFQTPNVDSLAGDHVPRFRKSALNSFPSFRQETAESQHFDQESKGFAVPAGRPANFPNFASIGGLRELQEGSEVASGSFNHEFKIPKVHIPDISVPQPLFRESFNFRKKGEDFYEHRTKVLSPVFKSQPVADNIVETFSSRVIPKTVSSDFSKLLRTSPNFHSSISSAASIFDKPHRPPPTSYSSQSFRPSVKDERVVIEQPTPVVNSESNLETDNDSSLNYPIEPQAVFVAVPDNISVDPPVNQEPELPSIVSETKETSDEFVPILNYAQNIEETINFVPSANIAVQSQSNIVIEPGNLQSSTSIVALNPIRLQNTDSIIESLNKLNLDNRNYDEALNNQVVNENILRPIELHPLSKIQNEPQSLSYNQLEVESKPQSISPDRPEREIEAQSFRVHQSVSESVPHPNKDSKFSGVHNEKSHFAVHDSSSSQSVKERPETFKVTKTINSEPLTPAIDQGHSQNVDDGHFIGNSKFIEIKPEFPQHPYIAQEYVPQSGYIKIPHYYEYDSIPQYETEAKIRGVFKPIVDFVKKV